MNVVDWSGAATEDYQAGVATVYRMVAVLVATPVEGTDYSACLQAGVNYRYIAVVYFDRMVATPAAVV